MRSRPVFVCTLLICALPAFADNAYRKPSDRILKILNTPPLPVASVSPTRTHLLLVQGSAYPAIAELAQPRLGLAGIRLNPANNAPHLPPRYVSLTLRNLDSGAETPVNLPPSMRLSMPTWSPDGQRLAFLSYTATAAELWIADVSTGKARRIDGANILAALDDTPTWMPDNRSLLVQLVPPGRGPAPTRSPAPDGPVIQESSGQSGPVRTYQDLLTCEHDERLFEHYLTAQLALIDADTNSITPLNRPSIFLSATPSPDGQHLLIRRVHRPYSYLHTIDAFPADVEIWSRQGQLLRKLASLPLADNIPIEGVPTGPRRHAWRPTDPATLVWAEALDAGDPRKKVSHRDRLLMLKSPFDQEPTEIFRTEHRFTAIQWLDDGHRALLNDYDRDRRWTRSFLFTPDQPAQPPQLLWSRSTQDRYNDPGAPLSRRLPNGHYAIHANGDSIFLTSIGASPQGDRPFLDRFDLKTRQTQRLFHSAPDCYESVAALLSDDGSRLLTRHESPTEPPNYCIRTADRVQYVTHFPDPAPELRRIRKQLVRYKRPDGVELSFTLYLPPDYQEGTRLPTVLWAYPREYNDPATAGQVAGSTQRFTLFSGTSHLFFLLEGYAVLDGAAMPVVGDPEKVNDTYIQQIASSAKAAIDKAAEMGVTDPNRVGIGGHSYGAFMTANLLAHSDLFRAGIARSGAYNRTLTPFGFQSERRTLWEAADTYLRMSPFLHAHQINEPILFIHGQDDDNPGTFPIQSERMYQAVRGNGGATRLVLLPRESHGYLARESVEHTLFEMIDWFDRHVKNAPPRSQLQVGGK